MTPASSDVTKALVAEGAALDAEVKLKRARLGEINLQLASLPPAIYVADNGATATVTAPGPTLKPKEESIEIARALIGDDKLFGKLFDRVVTWRPVKAFREVAAAVLPKAKASKVIETCEVESTPYVTFGG